MSTLITTRNPEFSYLPKYGPSIDFKLVINEQRKVKKDRYHVIY